MGPTFLAFSPSTTLMANFLLNSVTSFFLTCVVGFSILRPHTCGLSGQAVQKTSNLSVLKLKCRNHQHTSAKNVTMFSKCSKLGSGEEKQARNFGWCGPETDAPNLATFIGPGVSSVGRFFQKEQNTKTLILARVGLAKVGQTTAGQSRTLVRRPPRAWRCNARIRICRHIGVRNPEHKTFIVRCLARQWNYAPAMKCKHCNVKCENRKPQDIVALYECPVLLFVVVDGKPNY